jgi:cytidine deaminase
VIVKDGAIIASAGNRMREWHDPTAHAEMLAIRAACASLETERLTDCALWVTLEPCPACAGAIAAARIAKLYYAASDPKSGGVAQGPRVFDHAQAHHRPEVYSGLHEAASAALLSDFFAARR